MRHVIGLDLGGTAIKAAVVDETGKVRERKTVMTGAKEGPRAVLKRLAGLARELRERAEVPIEAVGVGIPGLFDAKRGVSVHSPNLGWRDVEVMSPLSGAIGLPVFAENDLRLAAWGESRFGAGRGVEHMVFVPLGTGMGAGVITHGRLLMGAHGFAGELGHIPLPWHSQVRCGCGGTGCVETVASATGIARLAAARLERAAASGDPGVHQSDLFQRVGGNLAQITAEDVAIAAARGDRLAREAWEEMCGILGWSLAVLVNLFNPELAVIGGGVSQAGDLLLEPVREALRRYAMAGPCERVEVRLSALGADAGMLGAAALALDNLPGKS